MSKHRSFQAIRGIPVADPGPGSAEGGPVAIQWRDLPENIREGLASLAKEDWKNAVVVASESRYVRLGHQVLSLFDAYWVKSRRVEDFLEGRLTGAERDTYYRRAVQCLQDLAATVIELGLKARLVHDLELDRRLLYRLAPEAWNGFFKDPSRPARPDCPLPRRLPPESPEAPPEEGGEDPQAPIGPVPESPS